MALGDLIKIAGWWPDADITSPGVLLDVDGYIPTKRGGMKAAPTGVTAGYAALAAECRGFVIARLVDNSTRTLAGTGTKLYEASGSTWTDVSRVVGGAYSASGARWRFGQVGNVTIAVNQFDTPQYSITSGAFANLSAMPKARYIATVNEFVAIGGTNEATYGDQADRWWFSALGDYTNWTPSVATQCVTGRLTDTPGPITAVRPFGDQVVYYKDRAIYVAQYDGPPVVWSFRLVSNTIGAIGGDSVVHAGYEHYFIGYEDFYRFDGTIPQPIPGSPKEWFFGRSNKSWYERIQGMYDRYRGNIWWFYAPLSSTLGQLTEYVVYNITSGKWGRGSMTVEAVAELLTATQTYDSFGAGLTWDTLPNVTYDSTYFVGSTPYPAVVNSSHRLDILSGVAGSNAFTTWYFGDDGNIVTLRRVKPLWQDKPDSATLQHYHTMTIGGSDTTGAAPTMGSLGRFDLIKAARWHKCTVTTSGDAELTGVAFDAVSSGEE